MSAGDIDTVSAAIADRRKTMAKAVSQPNVFTVEEFAGIFRLSPEAVRSLIRKGEIAAIRIGRQYRIPRQVVARLFAQAVAPEERGFGMWKGKPLHSVRYVNAVRNAERKSAEEFLASLVSETE
jgi:excisionase family DNA binding protein